MCVYIDISSSIIQRLIISLAIRQQLIGSPFVAEIFHKSCIKDVLVTERRDGTREHIMCKKD